MEVTRIRELTPYFIDLWLSLILCRNGSYPNKGIDTFLYMNFLENAFEIEMEVTRIRELTQFFLRDIRFSSQSRNGSYP